MLKVITGPDSLNVDPHNGDKLYLTVGNFDGVHRGHREFFRVIKEEAELHQAKMLVITFAPHPLQVLQGKDHFLINTFVERKEFLRAAGVDYLWEVAFTRDFSSLDPGEFIDKFILSFKNVKKIFLGHDFSFGANKKGDFKFAKDYCRNHNLELTLQDEYKFEHDKVSSTTIRKAIENGDMVLAKELLGRRYFLNGHVIRGAGRGRKIGFPTANISVNTELLLPQPGVYITKAMINGMSYFSVTNIGKNPTFIEEGSLSVETHLLDFNQDIYGEQVKVSFFHKIRNEIKFKSVNELIEQINKDVMSVRKFFSDGPDEH